MATFENAKVKSQIFADVYIISLICTLFMTREGLSAGRGPESQGQSLGNCPGAGACWRWVRGQDSLAGGRLDVRTAWLEVG